MLTEICRKISLLLPRQVQRVTQCSLSVLCSHMRKAPSILHREPSVVTYNLEQVRTNVRRHFYRPSERLRVAKHGYETRLKTPGGRAVIMRRILKGRFVLSH